MTWPCSSVAFKFIVCINVFTSTTSNWPDCSPFRRGCLLSEPFRYILNSCGPPNEYFNSILVNLWNSEILIRRAASFKSDSAISEPVSDRRIAGSWTILLDI